MRVGPLDASFDHRSSALVPALVVQDGNALGGTVRGTLGPWQALLTVVPQLTAYAFPSIREAGLVVVQRLAPDEATAALLDAAAERAEPTDREGGSRRRRRRSPSW